MLKRTCIGPGSASKLTTRGSATRPRKYGSPVGAIAVTASRAGGSSRAAADPGDCATGSHASVTRVLPFSPRAVPIQVLIRSRREAVASVDSAAVTAVGASGLGVVTRAVSSAVSAQ